MSKIKVTGINDIDQIIYDYKNSMEIWESRKQDVKKHIEECLWEEIDTEYVFDKILEQYDGEGDFEYCSDWEDFDIPGSPNLVEVADYFIRYEVMTDNENGLYTYIRKCPICYEIYECCECCIANEYDIVIDEEMAIWEKYKKRRMMIDEDNNKKGRKRRSLAEISDSSDSDSSC